MGPVEKGADSSLALCLARSAVFLTPVQGSVCSHQNFCSPHQPPGINGNILHITSLLKESDRPRELRGETRKDPGNEDA